MNSLSMITNAVRRLDLMFPGYFAETKHNHYADFGFPTSITFAQTYAMYQRNGLARAGIEKTKLKTWQSNPEIWETDAPDESTIESAIRQRFSDIRIWQRFADADRMSMVGGYSGVILRLADGKSFDQPVDRVTGGLDGLVEVIPAWAGQLAVGDWDTVQSSPNYGKPLNFQFNEAAVGSQLGNSRSFRLHPDRVMIWSTDGTVHCGSMLEPGYNDLMTMEKISGAGGEGFWKNAKSAPVLQVDKEARIEDMAQAMGVPVSKVLESMNEQVEDWQKGFDKLLMLQGIEAKTLGVTLPSPEHFFNIALQSYAASIGQPLKILVGSQSGERASTEDARDWSQTIMSRRKDSIVPNVKDFLSRLERFGILPKADWIVNWTDLTESTMAEKIDRADKMAGINQKTQNMGEVAFMPDEIRAVVGYEPLASAYNPMGEGL